MTGKILFQSYNSELESLFTGLFIEADSPFSF